MSAGGLQSCTAQHTQKKTWLHSSNNKRRTKKKPSSAGPRPRLFDLWLRVYKYSLTVFSKVRLVSVGPAVTMETDSGSKDDVRGGKLLCVLFCRLLLLWIFYWMKHCCVLSPGSSLLHHVCFDYWLWHLMVLGGNKLIFYIEFSFLLLFWKCVPSPLPSSVDVLSVSERRPPGSHLWTGDVYEYEREINRKLLRLFTHTSGGVIAARVSSPNKAIQMSHIHKHNKLNVFSSTE